MRNWFRKIWSRAERAVLAALMAVSLFSCGAQPTYAFANGIQTLNNSLMDVIGLAGMMTGAGSQKKESDGSALLSILSGLMKYSGPFLPDGRIRT